MFPSMKHTFYIYREVILLIIIINDSSTYKLSVASYYTNIKISRARAIATRAPALNTAYVSLIPSLPYDLESTGVNPGQGAKSKSWALPGVPSPKKILNIKFRSCRFSPHSLDYYLPITAKNNGFLVHRPYHIQLSLPGIFYFCCLDNSYPSTSFLLVPLISSHR